MTKTAHYRVELTGTLGDKVFTGALYPVEQRDDARRLLRSILIDGWYSGLRMGVTSGRVVFFPAEG